MRKLLGGIVALGLSIAIPATFEASWTVYAVWIVVGLAVVALIVLSEPVKRLIPYTLQRRDPKLDEAIGNIMQRYVLRAELQAALTNLNDNLTKPKPAELRAFGDNLAKRLLNDGYAITAKKAEVHLPDNVDEAAVANRRSELHTQLIRLLIWDEYE